MSEPTDQDIEMAKLARTIALVMASAGLLSIFAPWLTLTLGLQPRFEFLFYLIALAAFFWSLVVCVQIWQKTRK